MGKLGAVEVVSAEKLETAERSFPRKLVCDPQNGENVLSLHDMSLLYQFQPYGCCFPVGIVGIRNV
jgi:hypothetical protein